MYIKLHYYYYLLLYTLTNEGTMNGCRSLTPDEIQQVSDSFYGKYERRNRALFLTGVYTGYRISELLSLTYDNVYNATDIRKYIKVKRSDVKGKTKAREIKLHEKARHALREWVRECDWTREDFIFSSQKGKAISRVQAHRVLKQAFNDCQMDGTLATHTMRKTFADKVYKATDGDIFALKELLGHSNINTTQKYLGITDDRKSEIIDSI